MRRGNLSLDEKDRLVRDGREARARHAKELKTVYTRVGEQPRGSNEITEDTIGVIQFEFVDWQHAPPAHRDHGRDPRRDRRHSRHPGRGDGAARRPADRQADPGAARRARSRRCCRRPPRRSPRCCAPRPTSRDLDDGLPLPGIDWKLEVDKAEAAKYGADAGHGRHRGAARHQRRSRSPSTGPSDSDKSVDILVRFPRGPAQPRPDRRAARARRRSGSRADRQFRRARSRAARSATSTASTATASMTVSSNVAEGVQSANVQEEIAERARQGRSRPGRHLPAEGRGRGARQGRRLPDEGVRHRDLPDLRDPAGAVQQAHLGRAGALGGRSCRPSACCSASWSWASPSAW